MSEVFLAIWNILNISFNYGGITFTLWNVIEASIVISIIGFVLAKIFLFVNEKR